MKRIIPFAFLLLIVSGSHAQVSEGQKDLTVKRIAFGSCSDQKKADQQLWKEVLNEKPDLWIWLGDNVYSDGIDMAQRKKDFDFQKSHPDYKGLLEEVEIIGTWDDHDFGVNDGGKEYPKKDESRDLLFEFLDLPESHPAWERKGAYQAHTYDFENKRIKILLLDTRYFRDNLNWAGKPKGAVVNPSGEILGDEQWKWLVDQLKDEYTDLFLIISSIQVLASEHRFEKWSNFPSEHSWLMSTVDQVEKPLIFISGDRHISELSSQELASGKTIYDITSSSLTNPWGDPRPEVNKRRIGDLIYDPNFSILDIEWDGDRPVLRLTYIGKGNEVLQQFDLELN